MKIEDKELRDLFKIESEEHLEHLDSGFLRLEKDPNNKALLEELLREAHSIKGGARMVLMGKIETVAHRLESILAAAVKGEMPLTVETIDRLYGSLDDIRKLVNEAVTGEPAGVSVSEVLASLLPATDVGREEATSTPDSEKGVSGQPGSDSRIAESEVKTIQAEAPKPPMRGAEPEGELQPSEISTEGPRDGEFHIETIRVATDKLDALMSLLGELNVTKNRVATVL